MLGGIGVMFQSLGRWKKSRKKLEQMFVIPLSLFSNPANLRRNAPVRKPHYPRSFLSPFPPSPSNKKNEDKQRRHSPRENDPRHDSRRVFIVLQS